MNLRVPMILLLYLSFLLSETGRSNCHLTARGYTFGSIQTRKHLFLGCRWLIISFYSLHRLNIRLFRDTYLQFTCKNLTNLDVPLIILQMKVIKCLFKPFKLLLNIFCKLIWIQKLVRFFAFILNLIKYWESP